MKQCVSQGENYYMKHTDVKKEMSQAMVKLLERKPFINITVSDIVNEAGLSRGTFYRFFSNIVDLLDYIIIDLMNIYKTNVEPILLNQDEKTIKALLTRFFIAVKEGRIPFFNILLENLSVLISKLNQHVDFLTVSENAPLEEKYVPTLFINNVVAIAKVWARYGYKEEPALIADFTYNYIYRT